MRILLVEDEKDMAAALTATLSRHDVVVDHAPTLEIAEEACRSGVHDAVLLDRKLPDGDGLSLIPLLRREQPGLPVIVLSALGSSDQRIAGLDHGADDYLAKPFRVKELMARVRALRRRSTVGPMTDALEYGPLRLDPAFRCVVRGDKTSDLTATEYQLLAFLVEHPRQVFSKSQLLDRVWGWDAAQNENVVEAHVSSLRAKIGDDSRQLIRTVRGLGYVLGA